MHDKNIEKFISNSQIIEIVNKYTYLGVAYSNSAVFDNASKEFITNLEARFLKLFLF